MRILLLTHAFNSLTQRLWAELSADGHELSIEFDIADSVAEEAVALFRPDLILAPYLRRAIPEAIWSRHLCLVVHPGPPGDAGPSALDWAITQDQARWGVTVLQAEAEMDAGPVWAAAEFEMRPAKKGSLYRNEVTEAAVRAVRAAIRRVGEVAAGAVTPARPAQRHWQPLMTQSQRAIDWQRDDAATVLRKLRAADGFPGVADTLFGEPCHLYDAWPEARLRGAAGEIIARCETALCRATHDGAVWIGHAKRAGGIKLPATLAFADCAALGAVPPEPSFGEPWRADHVTWQDIAYEEAEGVGVLRFEFYNGAMSTAQCERLRAALAWAKARPVGVLVLAGGADFWSNGIHLNTIEAASLGDGSPADESMRNIEAMDELTRELIETPQQLTIAALGGNAGAGGCFLARAADQLWVRAGTLLNPHYKNMGNLYGSEYWTYLLPRRVGLEAARRLMQDRLPLTAARAVAIGFADAALPGARDAFDAEVMARARALAQAADLPQQLTAKREQRARDEAEKPLAAYRDEELAQMRRNFYGFDPSYHVARYHFVHKSPMSWTPRHLARHRDLGFVIPEGER